MPANRFLGTAVAASCTLLVLVSLASPLSATQHLSWEAEEGHPCCVIQAKYFGIPLAPEELGRTFPEWEAVERDTEDAGHTSSVILEGTVTTPQSDENEEGHVSFEDTPFGHYTHDMTFKVRPDSSYLYLLGIRMLNHIIGEREPCFLNAAETCPGPFPDSAACYNLGRDDIPRVPNCVFNEWTQDDGRIEVEWESGLGADNDDNPCHSDNEAGNSCGFFSAGHRRRDIIWNWPTVGDHVHVEGRWVWDRGHPPAVTEIHPPRLVATQRQLPAMLYLAGPDNGFVLATREDVFASGDGGALNNNRTAKTNHDNAVPWYVRRVRMSDRDYTFKITHPLPPPRSSARLNWGYDTRTGDTFQNEPIITQDTETGPHGVVHLLPSVTVTIPWLSRHAPDTDVFARTIYVWWGTDNSLDDLTTTHGVAADYHPRLFKVTLGQFSLNQGAHNVLEHGGDMELRVFVEAGGNWLFVNELVSDDEAGNILEEGVGDSGPEAKWNIVDRRSAPEAFTIVLPPGPPPSPELRRPYPSFRVHVGGWEADGVNASFGKLLNPNIPCGCEFQDQFNALFGANNFVYGRDDPIGELNRIFDCESLGAELGDEHAKQFFDGSAGKVWKDDIYAFDEVDQQYVFGFRYSIEELAWVSSGRTLQPGGGCDMTPPAITIQEPGTQIYAHSDSITLTYGVNDGTGAGVQSVTPKMDGEPTLNDGTGLATGQAIDFLTQMTVGQHKFSVDAMDYAGNASTASVSFAIVVTPGSLTDDVGKFLGEGKITLADGKPLLKLLAAAAAARAKGDCKTSNDIYRAFIQLLQAQSGKKIDAAAVQILIDDAQYLIEQCPEAGPKSAAVDGSLVADSQAADVAGPDGSVKAVRMKAALMQGRAREVELRLELPSRMPVRLTICDIAGRIRATLLDQELPGGVTQANWNGRDDGGERVASGMYFVRLAYPGGERVSKVVMLR